MSAGTGSRRWVVKIGSTLVTNDGRGFEPEGIGRWVAQMVALRARGVDVVVVSSKLRGGRDERLGLPASRGALRASGGRRDRPDGPRAGLRVVLPASRDPHRAGAADARGCLRPRPVPQCAQHAAPASALRRGAGDQRERRGRYAGSPARGQRHARRSRREPGRGGAPGHPHRPAGPVRPRSARRCRGPARRTRPGRRSGPRRDGGRRRDAGPRRNAHEAPGRRARRPVGHAHADRLRARARRAGPAPGRRVDRDAAGAGAGAARRAQAVAGRAVERAGAAAHRRGGREGASRAAVLAVGVRGVEGEFSRGEVVACFDPSGSSMPARRGASWDSAASASRSCWDTGRAGAHHRDNLVRCSTERGGPDCARDACGTPAAEFSHRGEVRSPASVDAHAAPPGACPTCGPAQLAGESMPLLVETVEAGASWDREAPELDCEARCGSRVDERTPRASWGRAGWRTAPELDRFWGPPCRRAGKAPDAGHRRSRSAIDSSTRGGRLQGHWYDARSEQAFKELAPSAPSSTAEARARHTSSNVHRLCRLVTRNLTRPQAPPQRAPSLRSSPRCRWSTCRPPTGATRHTPSRAQHRIADASTTEPKQPAPKLRRPVGGPPGRAV